jgi:hypothetical protein
MMLSLHPAPVEDHRMDHRDAENRDQLRAPGEAHDIWKRAVEDLASNLQIEPIQAHFILADAGYEMTKGLVWSWWT